jgi:hypothetical protein
MLNKNMSLRVVSRTLYKSREEGLGLFFLLFSASIIEDQSQPEY